MQQHEDMNMRIKGITESELRTIVEGVSDRLYEGNIKFKREPEQVGNFLHFTLTVVNSADAGGRISHSGRRVAALCWHGHRDVMLDIFAAHPDALLVTALARYDGQNDFHDKFPATGRMNIGSYYAPMDMQHACHC
jgi:hypothetical protein